MSYRKQLLIAAYRQVRSTGKIDAVLAMDLLAVGADPDQLEDHIINNAPRKSFNDNGL